jgi:transglutaminase-like putative cysteine protease
VADAAWALNRLVHEHFEYRSGATSVGTSAAAAFTQRKGVCQDYAHVMIAALRSIGLAARYVSGYLLTSPPPGQPRLLGADASHAWLEVWLGDVDDAAGAAGWEGAWWALDPTNAIACGADHVTVAWGRDYGDVAPLRGVVRGGAGAEPRVSVSVIPIDERVPSPGAA